MQRNRVRQFIDKYAYFFLLLGFRASSAAYNIIHDCDETYNYWEPLHYLVHGSGKQTWEYSPKYALRPYLYLIIHWLVAYPASVLASALGLPRRVPFYAVRVVLGALSAAADAAVVAGAGHVFGEDVESSVYLAMLSAGSYVSSTTLLPSTFSMYFNAAALAALLYGKGRLVIVCSVLGVVLGWNVAVISVAPYALYVLATEAFVPSLVTAVTTFTASSLAVLATDTLFYGRLTSSAVNFLKYNVAGGGDSSLYGVESWTFYLRNGLLNLGPVLPAALLMPVAAACCALLRGWSNTPASLPGKAPAWGTVAVAAVAPAYVWLAAISALPHKEERFLYPVYPQLCLAAALALSMLQSAPELLWRCVSRGTATKRGGDEGTLPGAVRRAKGIASFAVNAFFMAHAAFATARVRALLRYYRGPMDLMQSPIFAQDAQRFDARPFRWISVCLGTEWHRVPPSFLLPDERMRYFFLETAFDGALPGHFSEPDLHVRSILEGTATADEWLNDRNLAAAAQHIPGGLLNCDYLVLTLPHEVAGKHTAGLHIEGHSAPLGVQWGVTDEEHHALNVPTWWKVIDSEDLLLPQHNPMPTLYRALYIPYLSDEHYNPSHIVLLARQHETPNEAADDTELGEDGAGSAREGEDDVERDGSTGKDPIVYAEDGRYMLNGQRDWEEGKLAESVQGRKAVIVGTDMADTSLPKGEFQQILREGPEREVRADRQCSHKPTGPVAESEVRRYAGAAAKASKKQKQRLHEEL
ncbi:unnamed protein product [Pedinophyceae sp. YPF-701]|nr:unnamed protein product [Pedinophyceae sp. YPF-701]